MDILCTMNLSHPYFNKSSNKGNIKHIMVEVYKCEKFLKDVLKWVKSRKHWTLSIYYKNAIQTSIYLKLILSLHIN